MFAAILVLSTRRNHSEGAITASEIDRSFGRPQVTLASIYRLLVAVLKQWDLLYDPHTVEQSDASLEDRRRTHRFSCGGQAKIGSLPSDGILVPGRVFDLSLGGCCVESAQTLEKGGKAEILLRVGVSSFRAVGQVREMRDGAKICMEFLHLSSGGQSKLAELVRQLATFQANMVRLRFARGSRDAEFSREHFQRILSRPLLNEVCSVSGTAPMVSAESILESTRESLIVCRGADLLPVNLYT